MIVKKVTEGEMIKALAMVSALYDGNIIWNRFERKGNQFHFTLRCRSSAGPGHSYGRQYTGSGMDMHLKKGRRLISCCWHVHGHFFDALLELNPAAVIMSRGKRIDIDGGNWQDFNTGSMISPVAASENCDCEGPLATPGGSTAHKFKYATLAMEAGQLVETNARMIPQGKLTPECWLIQMRGFEACDDCEFRDTDECGGQHIRRTGRNAAGYKVPLE